MSVRDTGWLVEPEHASWRASVRRMGAVTLIAYPDGRWWAHFNAAMESQEGVAVDLEAAKRAAEDALRQLCRDTLAALGATDPA